MLSAGEWILSQQNKILFVLVDASGNEMAGLGTTWTLELSKNGAAFAAGGGTKAEVGDGWYSYLSTSGEADTRGPIAVKVTHASIVQQNLEYYVGGRNPTGVEFTYTVTDVLTSAPIEGVYCIFATDATFNSVVWTGNTDAFGVARDANNELPWLDPGTYYIRLQRSGYDFSDDTEVVA